MMRDTYIDKDCRYYKGEEANPFIREEGWLWECEHEA